MIVVAMERMCAWIDATNKKRETSIRFGNAPVKGVRAWQRIPSLSFNGIANLVHVLLTNLPKFSRDSLCSLWVRLFARSPPSPFVLPFFRNRRTVSRLGGGGDKVVGSASLWRRLLASRP